MERGPEDARREVALMAAYNLLSFVRAQENTRSTAIVMAIDNIRALLTIHYPEGKQAFQEAGIPLP